MAAITGIGRSAKTESLSTRPKVNGAGFDIDSIAPLRSRGLSSNVAAIAPSVWDGLPISEQASHSYHILQQDIAVLADLQSLLLVETDASRMAKWLSDICCRTSTANDQPIGRAVRTRLMAEVARHRAS